MGVTAGIVEFADLNIASQEGPHLVRLRKAGLRRRINGPLTLRYEAGGLTSFAGLELVGRFLRRLDFRGTFNLMTAVQAGTTERRSTNRKRRAMRPFQTIQTLRYGLINRAGLLVQPGGCQILDVGNNPTVQERFKTVESALAA